MIEIRREKLRAYFDQAGGPGALGSAGCHRIGGSAGWMLVG
jgi:hypothetical protein